MGETNPFLLLIHNEDLWQLVRSHTYPGKKTSNYYDYKSGDVAAANGYLTLMKERKDFRYTNDSTKQAAGNGHVEVLAWLKANTSAKFNEWTVNAAARGGHINTLSWLKANTKDISNHAVDYAAENGHVETLIWLKGRTLDILITAWIGRLRMDT